MAKKKGKADANSRWILVNSMFDELGLVRQHLDSFNDFIEKGLQSVIEEIKVIEPEDSEFYVKLEKVEVEEPTIREADGERIWENKIIQILDKLVEDKVLKISFSDVRQTMNVLRDSGVFVWHDDDTVSLADDFEERKSQLSAYISKI